MLKKTRSFLLQTTIRQLLFFFILVAILTVPNTPVFGQSYLDSLEKLNKSYTKQDEGKIKLLHKLTSEYLNSNPEKSLTYINQAIQIAQKLKNQNQLVESYGLKGLYYSKKSQYIEAISIYEKALNIKNTVGNERSVIRIYGNLGNVYNSLSNYVLALEYYHKALHLTEKSGDSINIAAGKGNIGLIYYETYDFQKALEYLEQALHLYEALDYDIGVASNLLNISNVYSNLEDDLKAYQNAEKALVIYEKIGHKRGMAVALTNLAGIFTYLSESDFDSLGIPPFEKDLRRLDYYQKAYDIQDELGNPESMALILANIGRLYCDIPDVSLIKIGVKPNKRYEKSLEYINKSLALAIDIGSIGAKLDAYFYFSEVYEIMGDHANALFAYKQYIVLQDSIQGDEVKNQITRKEIKFEFDKKSAVAIEEQKKKDYIAAQKLIQQKRLRNGFIGGFAVVLLFAGVFFKQRNKIGKEKKRSEELLLNILPAEVAEELKAKGAAEAQLIDDATVLFTDFKGFTGMSEILTAKELVADLNHCFTAFDEITHKHRIEKIKTIGDAYMAAGGLPTPNTTHAKDVVLAALEIRDFIEEGKAHKIANNQPFFEIRIGIHTGPLVAGIVGVKKFQYDIWGDTVNTASRMESSGEVGKVNISQYTYELLKDDPDFEFEHRGKISAKGKGEIEMLFVSLKNKNN